VIAVEFRISNESFSMMGWLLLFNFEIGIDSDFQKMNSSYRGSELCASLCGFDESFSARCL